MRRRMRRVAQNETGTRNETRNSAVSHMNRRLVCVLGVALAFFVVLGFSSATQAQMPTQPGSGNGSTGMSGSQGSGMGHGLGRSTLGTLGPDDDNFDPTMAERRMRALNIERQKQMVSDAAKLLKLAQELNSEVAASNSGAFTPDQLRRVGEIEKLARSVRERMSAAVGETPTVLPPPTLVYPVH
jgi:hypothetical protein